MEISWKWLNFFLNLLFCQLCNGFPINFEDRVADQHTQLLTGLVAVLLTVCSIVLLAGCLCCQRTDGFKEFRDSPVVATATSNLDHGHVNPIVNGEFTIFTPLSPPHFNNNLFLASEQIITRTSEDYVYGDFDVSSWFNESEKDFPRVKLKYIKKLGKGWFGKVVEGAAQDLHNHGQTSWTPVVVRILEATATRKERVMFLQDAAIYRCGSHPNILSLFGRCLDTVPLLLLQEFCPQGDLKNYLRSNKVSAHKLLSTEYPLIWCCQLTSALKHLHDNQIIHPDLATHNCQLTSDLTLKLGDYGLATFNYPEDYYQGSSGVPVRWCAPESLTCTLTTIQPKKITPEGNVWSLGVTIWEICECGEQPYSNLSDDEVVSQVLGSPNVRLSRPIYSVMYTDYIYRLMQLCWTNAESRPTITQIDLMLTDLLQVHRNTNSNSSVDSSLSVDDFDKRWESLKPNSVTKVDHLADSIAAGLNKSESNIIKPLSPSLNNLHGSLDNLMDCEPQMESWLKNVTEANDLSYVEGLSNIMRDLDSSLALEISSSDSGDHTSPKLKAKVDFDINTKSQRTSSESESEGDNWRHKVERGAYTEKVRLKSKSVADLMVLTHVDYSESESETPLPSLDYRVNYKNVRYAPKSNIENVSLTFGSEGNLLTIQDTFQEELRKLQEERRDSLLFVPDINSQFSFNKENKEDLMISDTNKNLLLMTDSPSKRLMHELNSTAEIKPANQVFNVFNVTIDKFTPMCINSKLDEFINFSKDFSQPKCNSAEKNSVALSLNTVDIHNGQNCTYKYIPCDKNERNISEFHETYPNNNVSKDIRHLVNSVNTPEEQFHKLDMNEQQTTEKDNTTDLLLKNASTAKICKNSNLLEYVPVDCEYSNKEKNYVLEVPKLSHIILNNKKLMDCILLASHSENIFNKQGTETEIGYKNESHIFENTHNSKDIACYNSDSPTADASKSVEIVSFDISSNQEEIMPNSLTHVGIFASTPFRKKQEMPLPSSDTYSSLNLFQVSTEIANDTSEFSPVENTASNKDLNYSLETWDNFLGKTLDNQSGEENENLFDSFSSEPQSILFFENEDQHDDSNKLIDNPSNVSSEENNKDVTFVVNEVNSTFVINCDNEKNSATDTDHVKNEDYRNDQIDEVGNQQNLEDNPGDSSWESGGGWFLHPQSTNEDVYGEMEIQPSGTDSYVGFGIDDEVMAAIRNELLTKLPHAQGTPIDRTKEEEEWDSGERNEVFLKYNVYNTPLSPIPEESYIEELSGANTPKQESENESDWSAPCEAETLPPDTESHSAHTHESPFKGLHHRHTPSQDSCCSNDTLFNLEELTNATTDIDKEIDVTAQKNDVNIKHDLYINEIVSPEINCETRENNDKDDIFDKTFVINSQEVTHYITENSELNTGVTVKNVCEIENLNYINNFLFYERQHTSTDTIKIMEPSHNSDSLLEENHLGFIKTHVAPLPSPEENPWKQLPASLLTYDKVISQTGSSFVPATVESENNLFMHNHLDDQSQCEDDQINEPQDEFPYRYDSKYQNCPNEIYENVKNTSDFHNDADYVNIINLENTKKGIDFSKSQDEGHDYINIYEPQGNIINDEKSDDIFGVLTDIRFNGPTDNQLMSTSFSESNDLNDEQDWDSGSDTRSSSSGEFIWKEGEHEESLKALRAAPQDVYEDIKPMEEITEVSSEGSDLSSSSSCSDDDGETPEFVPSAWDKFATPTKSALRSPVKTLEKTESKKAKGVWFKKQKYHCVYEYPREPESPVLQSQDLWKPQMDYSSFTDWEFDADAYLPPPTDDNDIIPNTYTYQPKSISTINLYQLTSISDFVPSNSTGLNDEFFITGSAQPFDTVSSLSSQFFPGNSNWIVENATPDSGVEDITPGNSTDSNQLSDVNIVTVHSVPTLKKLASEAVNSNRQNIKNNDVLGGLRHTRNKLKLDLPLSPNAFTMAKIFMVEPMPEPVVREKPTFSTFGKSRFLVQHVDTPPEDSKGKNVSFEALPYRALDERQQKKSHEHFENLKNTSDFNLSDVPQHTYILKDETFAKKSEIRGEANLLDSADEDSGIESSTLERKFSNNT